MARADVSIVSAQVPSETRAELERLAQANERNVSQELRRAIAEHLRSETRSAERMEDRA
jgi:predicted transcriptional regulator